VGASGVASRWLVDPVVKAAHIPEVRGGETIPVFSPEPVERKLGTSPAHRRRWQPSSPMPAPRPDQRIPVSKTPPMCSWYSVYGPSVTSTLPSGRARSVFALPAGEMPQANFPHAAAISSRLSAWISSHHRFGYDGRVEVVGR